MEELAPIGLLPWPKWSLLVLLVVVLAMPVWGTVSRWRRHLFDKVRSQAEETGADLDEVMAGKQFLDVHADPREVRSHMSVRGLCLPLPDALLHILLLGVLAGNLIRLWNWDLPPGLVGLACALVFLVYRAVELTTRHGLARTVAAADAEHED